MMQNNNAFVTKDKHTQAEQNESRRNWKDKYTSIKKPNKHKMMEHGKGYTVFLYRQWSSGYPPAKVCLLISVQKPAWEKVYKLILWICRELRSLTVEFPFLHRNSWCLSEPNSGCLLTKIVLKCLRWIITWPHLNYTQRSLHPIVVTKGFRVKWENNFN